MRNKVDEYNLKFNDDQLIPVIVQNHITGKVLMLGYMNQESFEKTIETNQVWFFSRSRNKLWLKGETSGHYLNVVEILSDCDNDTLLIKAQPIGPTCHTGNESCFFNTIKQNDQIKSFDHTILYTIYDIIEDRKSNPIEGSYTNYLFEKGIDKILKKVGEETAETIIAAKNRSKDEITFETSDLLYHLLVMLSEQEVTLDEVLQVLYDRHHNEQ